MEGLVNLLCCINIDNFSMNLIRVFFWAQIKVFNFNIIYTGRVLVITV